MNTYKGLKLNQVGLGHAHAARLVNTYKGLKPGQLHGAGPVARPFGEYL